MAWERGYTVEQLFLVSTYSSAMTSGNYIEYARCTVHTIRVNFLYLELPLRSGYKHSWPWQWEEFFV